ncbi:MAG TPA: hypothetical protein VFR78_24215 [Pyrinomonadaceae bacterium]|nr:hypothetical protein [Pyrinomonadaceae bacterium]
MIVKLIAAAVLGLCAVSTSGVMAQQPAPSTVRVIEYNGDLAMLMAALPNTYGVTVGLELDTQARHTVRLSLQDATIADVMNAMVQSSKKFQWQQTGWLVEVWPAAGSNPLLDTKIGSFNVREASPAEAFDKLLTLPEVEANMTTLKLKRRAPESGSGELSSPRFSLALEGVTLREALNKIAQESRLAIWTFRNYPNGFFSISAETR